MGKKRKEIDFDAESDAHLSKLRASIGQEVPKSPLRERREADSHFHRRRACNTEVSQRDHNDPSSDPVSLR